MITIYRKNNIVTQGNESEVELRGLSTDIKPTIGIINGTKFIEIDTDKVAYYDAENVEWIGGTEPIPPTPPAELLVLDFRECEEDCGGYKTADAELCGKFFEQMVAAYQASTSFSFKVIDLEGSETIVTGDNFTYDEPNEFIILYDATDGTISYDLSVDPANISIAIPEPDEVEEIQG